MNTHDIDIELPTLPEPEGQHFSHKNTYSLPQMNAFARAAIEADRQRRGEPVGYLVELDGRDTYVSADRTVRDAHLTYGWRPVYAAPQPAEPVKVPSDEEILETLESHGALVTQNSLNAVRALLARYGQK